MFGHLSPKYIKHPLVHPDSVEFRLYQKRIAKTASVKNTLVILPTALGKTVISAIVTAEILYNYQNVKVLVMAPTRPLVMQHKESFMKFIKLRENDTVLLTGKTAPSFRRGVWHGKAKVFFATPQVVRNDLREHRFSLKNYGLLVFDECHRAVKKYAYTKIAEYYVSQAKYPIILGMTASPGSELSRVLDVCKNLYIEQVEYRSEKNQDVKPYIQPIKIDWRRVNLPSEYLEIKSIIRSMLNKRLVWLYQRGILKHRPKYATRKSILEVGNELRLNLEESIPEERGKIFTAIINQSLAMTLFHMLVLIETQGLWTLKAFLDRVVRKKREKRSYSILLGGPEYKRLRSFVDGIVTEHPKAELLKKMVSNQIKQKPTSRMIVFTQYRDTATNLVMKLNNIVGIRADKFVGQTSKLLDKGLTQDEQAERIRSFKDGVLNVLVATSIAEEGLDIPVVDHVIFYEPIPSEIRYIQRRGRTGRKYPGKVTILTTNDSLDMVYLYVSKRRIAKMNKIAENINSKLQPIQRKKQKQILNPLTATQLQVLEEEIKQTITKTIIKTETEVFRDIRKKVNRASRNVYLKLLEKGGKGASLEQIASDMAMEGTSLPILESALEKMMKEKLITVTSYHKYAVSSAVNRPKGKIFKVTVEKIYPGLAVVKVDDKWRARLTHQDYNGPRKLIKKNLTFTATGKLYRMDGVLCLKVETVTQIS